MKLIAVILTYNEAANIAACIASLDFADRVVVFNSFSEDETVALAQEAGAEVIQRKFDNYAAQRNAALDAVTGRADWTLFIDADERVTPKLAAEIQSVLAQPDFAAWRIPRHNMIFGHLTREQAGIPIIRPGCCAAVRLAMTRNVRSMSWSCWRTGRNPGAAAAYIIIIAMSLSFTINSAVTALTMRASSTNRVSGPKPQNYVLQPWRQFWWRFVTLKGYRDGWHGLRLSLLMAWYELRKYRVLREMWRKGAM